MKDLLKYSVISIGIALTIFCLSGVVFDCIYDGNFVLRHYNFTRMVIGAILVGLGFGLPTVVYQNDRMAMPIQCLIHMGVGCIVYLAVAFNVGWIPVEHGLGICIGTVMGMVAAAVLIWFIFFQYYKKMAYKMNQKIEEYQRNV